MTITIDQMTIPGALPEGSSPHPVFHGASDQKLFHDDTLTKKELTRFGTDCGAKILPYRTQDRYIRSENPVTIKTIVMENNYLKAVFLPGFGGKLWSLYSKKEDRELLFVNPIFRPANLANRNAWTAGGIEWNLGHTGHCAFTCDHVFCTSITAPDGEIFLRIYEYEATHAQIMQLDFHLPDGAMQLAMHVRIENARSCDSSLYWWTNIAVPLTANTRVFSGTADILYQLTPDPADNIPGFGRCKMPIQPNLDCDDISYPRRIPHSIEYFFQNSSNDPSPFEVSIEADGKGLLERSTQPLSARKMFCWGNSVGGRHWCDYLSQDGQGDYIEIQAGLAPTQNHTTILKPNEIISFTQMFAAFTAPECAQAKEWNAALPEVAAAAESMLHTDFVQTCHREYLEKSVLPCGEALHTGSIYGALENARRIRQNLSPLAPHLIFDCESADLQPWLDVLAGKPLPDRSVPISYVTDPLWKPYLEAISAINPQSKFQYAVLLEENAETKEAETLLSQLSAEGNAYASYALGTICRKRKEAEKCEQYHSLALQQAGPDSDVSFLEAAIAALLFVKKYKEAWELYEQAPSTNQTEAAILSICEAALQLEKFDFLETAFQKEFSSIREGAVGLADIWLEYTARKRAAAEGGKFSRQDINSSCTLPRNLNFRMFD